MTPQEKRQKALAIERREKALAIEEEESFYGDLAQDIALPLAQGATLNFADEIYGGTIAAGRKLKGDKAPFMDMMREEAEPMRKAYKESLDRSPWIAGGSEMVGGMISPLSKIGKAASIGKGVLSNMVEGLISGIGASEEKITSPETAKVGAVSGAASGAMSLLTRGASRLIPRDAGVKRANVMGAGVKELQEKGIKSRGNMANRLNEKGFFGAADRDFDPASMKFKRKISLEGSDPNTPVAVKLKARAESAISKLQNEKENIWPAVQNKIIPDQEVENIFSRAVGEYTDKNPLYGKALEASSGLKEDLISTLRLRGQEKAALAGQPYQGITLRDLDELKSQLYDYTSFGRSLSDLPDSDIMYQNFARSLKDKVNQEVGNPNFAKFNDAQSDFLTTRMDLTRKLAQQDSAQRRNIWDKAGVFIGDTLMGDEAGLAGATLREGLDKIPYPLRRGAESATERLPSLMFRQNMVEGEIPSPISREPNSVIDEPILERNPESIEKPMAELPEDFEPVLENAQEIQPTEINWGSGVNMGEKDAVQKVIDTLNPKPLTFNPYVNEEILNTPLPRDTERLLMNPMVLKSKLSQAAPQHLPMLEDMLQNDQEGLRKAAPMIAQLVPSMFERDDYNSFDGKIVDPQMQQKFMADLKRDEGLSAIDKAKIAIKIRRGEPV